MKIVDLFCGAGGLSLGFQMAGHEVVAAFDADPVAVDTYNRNIGEHAHVADLRELNIGDLPDADGIIGGPPCQALSQSNTVTASWQSPRNLIPRFVEIVKVKRPRFFVMENVTGLLNYADDLSRELNSLQALGYFPVTKVLNAAHYGVPQDRKRVFIVGYRDGHLPIFPAPTHNRRSAITARQAIGGMLDEPEDELPTYMRHLAGMPDKIISGCNRSLNTKGKFLYWRNFDRPMFTIMARGSGAGGINRAYVGGQSYKLRSAHNSVLQSFPASFTWPDAIGDAGRLIGNAVPPLLAWRIAQTIE